MSTGWQHAYSKSLAKVVIAKGEPARVNESTYGWVDYELLSHLRGHRGYTFSGNYSPGPCEIIVTDDSVHENSISEFVGTDVSNDYNTYAEIRHCQCSCGAATDFTMRYKGSLGDLLGAIEVLDSIDPEAVVPADEVDAQISIATTGIHRRLTRFQDAVQGLADTYALKSADPSITDEQAVILALVAADLLQALRESERP